MNTSARDRLLDDVLPVSGLADSLEATRRAARQRRVRRRAVHSVTAIGIAVTAAWLGARMAKEPPALVEPKAPGPAPGFVVVATAPADSVSLVRTAAAADDFVVTTRRAGGAAPSVTEDDLFALAGARPAAIHRLADGSSRWMWLDQAR